MVELCKKISESKAFTNFILCVIGAAAVVVVMQTYKGFELEHLAVLDTLDAVILGIFYFRGRHQDRGTGEATAKLFQGCVEHF